MIAYVDALCRSDKGTRCRSGQIKSKRDVSSALIMAMMKRQVFDRRGVSPLHRQDAQPWCTFSARYSSTGAESVTCRRLRLDVTPKASAPGCTDSRHCSLIFNE